MLSSASDVLITMRLRNVYIYAHDVRTMSLHHPTCMPFYAVVMHTLHDEVPTALAGAAYYAKLIHESR
jgi:hypothetical protein